MKDAGVREHDEELLVICWACNTGMLATQSMLGGVIECPTCKRRNIVSQANSEPIYVYESREYRGPRSSRIWHVKGRCQGCDAKVKVAINYDARSESKLFKYYCPECGYENKILCCSYKAETNAGIEKHVRFGFTFKLDSITGRKTRLFMGIDFQSAPEKESTEHSLYLSRMHDSDFGAIILVLTILAILIMFTLVFVVRVVP